MVGDLKGGETDLHEVGAAGDDECPAAVRIDGERRHAQEIAGRSSVGALFAASGEDRPQDRRPTDAVRGDHRQARRADADGRLQEENYLASNLGRLDCPAVESPPRNDFGRNRIEDEEVLHVGNSGSLPHSNSRARRRRLSG